MHVQNHVVQAQTGLHWSVLLSADHHSCRVAHLHGAAQQEAQPPPALWILQQQKRSTAPLPSMSTTLNHRISRTPSLAPKPAHPPSLRLQLIQANTSQHLTGQPWGVMFVMQTCQLLVQTIQATRLK